MLLGQNRSHNGTGTAGTQLAGNPVPPVTPASPGRTLNRRSERPGRSHVPHPCLPAKEPIQSSPGTPDSRAPVRFFPTRRRGEESPGDPRRRCSRDDPEPSDREPAPKIRSNAHKILAIRSRSDGRDSRLPVRLGKFVKETLGLLDFNPRSCLTQKYLRLGPVFIVLAPELPRI